MIPPTKGRQAECLQTADLLAASQDLLIRKPASEQLHSHFFYPVQDITMIPIVFHLLTAIATNMGLILHPLNVFFFSCLSQPELFVKALKEK